MNSRFLLSNCTVISENLFIDNGSVLVEHGKITGVFAGPDAEGVEDTPVYDLGGRILMPGLVNPHTHLYSALSAGLSPKGQTRNFTEVLSNLWWPLDSAHDEESIYCSAVSGIFDAVKHGVTCIVDHHASMNRVKGSLDTIASAFRLSGLKGILCFETSDRSGVEKSGTHIEENLRFIDENMNSSNLRGMLGMHANLTLSDKTLKTAADLTGRNPEKYPVHIHCGEDKSDTDFCIEQGFSGPVDRLNSYGLLSNGSILAHCIHLSFRDLDILRDLSPFIVSNPESNANNRVGKPDRSAFPSYLIGTDGMSMDMISSLRSQFLLGTGLSEDFGSLYESFFNQPRQLLKYFFPGTGLIENGFDADIAVLDYIPETPISAENIMGHLIYGARGGRVYMTVAAGNILYLDGKLTFTSEASLRSRIKSAAADLHRRYYG